MPQQLLSVLTLGVGDLVRSRQFYVDGLGWPVVLDVPGEVCFVQVGHGLLLSLYPATSQDHDSGSAPSTGPGNVVPAHNVPSEDDVRRVTELFRAAGAVVLQEPQRASWGGFFACCADPDGVRWEIAHNPGLTVAADGTVTLGPV